MDTSRRAVESYWRSRMIDGATSDEDKVTPVYKLEEICDLLRSSHVSIVKEVSEFILKRLDHKNPVVKQKALRLIKYAVGKSGVEFRREMQRNSVAVRNLFHYRGHPDPLKGDALNKAVRDTAHEAISAIFSEENSKPAVPEGINRRIEGFGNTNFEPPSEDKKSFLSEVVGIGSASIKQGLSTLSQGHLPKKNENGSYSNRGPNLHRSLNVESENSGRYEPVKLGNDGKFGMSKNMDGGSWSQFSGVASENSASGHVESKTREEKLLETIVTSGGVRLQPTRDALQVFLLEAAKLDAVALSIALDTKLQSPMWQVRMKAVCVLEAILRKREDEHFFIVANYFSENKDIIERCSESPQSSLREKANRVLSLLNGGQASGLANNSEDSMMHQTAFTVDLPNLIDTGDSDYTTDDTGKNPCDINIASTPVTAAPLMDDLFGDGINSGMNSTEKKSDDDPFADVSFHSIEVKGTTDDLFSGMTIGEKPDAEGNHVPETKMEPELFDVFGSSSQLKADTENPKNLDNLMAGLSINENTSNQKGSSSGTLPESLFAVPSTASHQAPDNPLGGMLGSQIPAFIQNPMLPGGIMPYNFPPGIMLSPSFASQQFNYAAMGNLLAQQQLLGSMSSFQQLGNMNAQVSGSGLATGTIDGCSSPLPDIFQANFSNQAPASVMNCPKKEDTRAFDFISDHLAAARDTKRVS